MRTALSLAFAAMTLSAIAAPPAAADRRGRDEPAPSAQQVTVTQERAVAIARANGMVRLHEVKFDDGRWEVEGWTAAGAKIEFDIHPVTGAIMKQEIYSAPR